jgi:hypothetical protein
MTVRIYAALRRPALHSIQIKRHELQLPLPLYLQSDRIA